MTKIIKMPKRIYMSEDDMEIFVEACWGESVEVPNMEGFTDFYCEPSEGYFDFDKAASYNFPFYATSPEGVEYCAMGGWYNSNGHNFTNGITFEELIPQPSFEDEINALGLTDIPVATVMEIYKRHS